MPRKSNEDLKNMTLRQLNAYSDTNPAEGLRIADACLKTQKIAANNYFKYQKEKVMNTIIPGFGKDLDLE